MCGSLQLILRSINSSRSAYASISFINTFFNAYNIFGATVVQAGVLAKVGRFWCTVACGYLGLATVSCFTFCR